MLKFHMPFLGIEEEKAVLDTLRSCNLAGAGVKSQLLEDYICKKLGVKYALTVNSGTSALELAMMVLGVKPGDEVIMPSFTFVSTANAVLRSGGMPVFVDIRENDFNIDPSKIEPAITKRTKAIIVVHYAGVGCDMDKIMALAKKHRLFVVEDAAHAVGAKYRGKYLGTIADIGCFSFHQTKNIACGEGGAFVTQNNKIFNKAEIMREKGTDRSRFLRKEIDKYTWIDCGSSFIMSDLLSAIALEQFKKLGAINKKRAENAAYLLKKLRPLEKAGKLVLPRPDKKCLTNWHIFAILVAEPLRDWVLSALKAEGIEATFHFIPLHSSPFVRKTLKMRYSLPVTENVSRRIIRLPIYPQLKKSDMDDIANALSKALNHKKEK